MIFPEFENMEIIDNIRAKYDPLAQLVRPHITLVFPFENEMSNEAIEDILVKRLRNVKPFEIELNGISMQEDRFGNYLFLDVKKGADDICFVHEILYKNEFKQFDLGFGYKPHMTIGKLQTVKALNIAYDDLRNMDETFTAMINKISVEMIGEKEESMIIIEKKL
jgi:2'-5' RNA ligase